MSLGGEAAGGRERSGQRLPGRGVRGAPVASGAVPPRSAN